MNEENYELSGAPSTLLKDYTVTPLFEKRGVDIIIAAALVLLSISGVSALFWGNLSLGYTLVFIPAVIIISAFLIRRGKKPDFTFTVCGVMSVICSVSFSVTSNVAVKVISLFATAIAAVIWFTHVSGKEYEGADHSLILYFFTTVYRAASDLPGIFKSLFAKGKSESKTVSKILIGIVCAVPAVLIIVPILANADDAFNALITGIFDDYFTLIQKTVLGLGLSVFAIALVFSLKYNDTPYKDRELKLKANSISLSAFLCVLCFVYLVYLFSQLAYFFSAFSSILPKGYRFTYAQYARRGFFELCVISVINLLFIFAAVLISEKKSGKIPLSVKLPAAFIALFTFAIIFTAISKMVMYIGVYGCTVLRICTSAFMIWLFILFVCLFIRIFAKRFDVLKCGLIFALLILAVLGIGNVNAQIARYNYNAYKEGKIKMDVVYISKLGDEGIPYLYKLTKDKDEETAYRAKTELSGKYYIYYSSDKGDIKGQKFSSLKKTDGEFSKYTPAKHEAYKILEKYAKENKGKLI